MFDVCYAAAGAAGRPTDRHADSFILAYLPRRVDRNIIIVKCADGQKEEYKNERVMEVGAKFREPRMAFWQGLNGHKIDSWG